MWNSDHPQYGSLREVNTTLPPSSSVIPEMIEYSLTTPPINKTQSPSPTVCGKKLRENTYIFLLPAKIRGKAIPQCSKIFELSNDIKLQLKDIWTSSWEVCPYCQTWALLSYRPGKPGNLPVTWLAVKQSCCLSSFFFKKEILLKIYLSSWICELYPSSLPKNCQSLFSSNMTSATSYFSLHIPFSMILYLFLIFSSILYFLDVAWIISSDLSSSLLILSLAVSNCF